MRPYFPHSPLKIFGFFIVAIFFVIASSSLIYLAKGYVFELNGLKLTFNKTGMIIFSSRPSDADVTLNGKIIKKNAASQFFPTKIPGLETGQYTLRLKKDGFIDWEKSILVEEELVSWLDYIILFPLKPKIDALVEDGRIISAKQSDDLRRIAYIYENKDKEEEVWSFDALTLSKSKAYTLGEKDKGAKLSDLVWSADASKILFRKSKGENAEYIAANARDEGSINITDSFKMDFQNIVWSPTDSNELFWLKDGSVYRINIQSKTMSASFADKVVNIRVADDRKIYLVRDVAGERSLWQMDSSGSNLTNIVKSLPNSKNYSVRYSTANGHLLILVDGSVRTLYIAKNIGGKVELTEISKDAVDAHWAPDGKRILYRNEKNIWTYDLEKEKEVAALADADVRTVKWYIDSRHVVARVGDEYRIVEFDGGNSTLLGKISSSELMMSLEFKYLFYLGSLEDKKENVFIYHMR